MEMRQRTSPSLRSAEVGRDVADIGPQVTDILADDSVSCLAQAAGTLVPRIGTACNLHQYRISADRNRLAGTDIVETVFNGRNSELSMAARNERELESL